MIVTAWNNGRHDRGGAGYGLKIKAEDRNIYFDAKWKSVVLELEGCNQDVEVNIDKLTFWNECCRELISKDIGVLLRQCRLIPWTKGKPPNFEMVPISGNRFFVRATNVRTD